MKNKSSLFSALVLFLIILVGCSENTDTSENKVTNDSKASNEVANYDDDVEVNYSKQTLAKVKGSDFLINNDFF